MEGSQTIVVTFTPNDATNYNPAQAAVSVLVTKATPTNITWPTPPVISYGTGLTAAQLDAKASVPGSFVYTPGDGEILPAGRHTLSVTFTPADTNFPPAQASVALIVTKARPVITWPTPAPITYGERLSAIQLEATASVAGTFVYTPAASALLPAGRQTISASFTPSDSTNYTTAQADVSLLVNKEEPTVTWVAPKAISYGTPLNADQLNAVASVPGEFAYAPGPGTVLTAGKQILSVTFTPADPSDYTTAQATVELSVEELPDLTSLTAATDEQNSADAYQPAQVYTPVEELFQAPQKHPVVMQEFYQPQPISREEMEDPFQPLRVRTLEAAVAPQPQPVSRDGGDDPFQLLRAKIQEVVDPFQPQPQPQAQPQPQPAAIAQEAEQKRWVEDKIESNTPSTGAALSAEQPSTSTSTGAVVSTEPTEEKPETPIAGSTLNQQVKIETRTYKGAVYEKGADGQWHLQQK